MVHTSKSFVGFREHNKDLGDRILEYYGMYWVIQELLSQNKNKILISELQSKIDEYSPTKIPFEEIISFFRVEEDYVYSAFQRVVAENHEKSKHKRIEAGELKQIIDQKNAIIKRLEEKIEFLKNPKPLLKKRK